jgi:DNA-binding transcriptional LysR family regulator
MNKKPSLRSLEAFHAVVTLGSVSAAAGQMFVTEPAISHLLRGLEKATGLILFGKKGRRLDLTPDGHLFFEETASAMSVLTRLDTVAAAIRSAKHGHIRLVAIPVVADYLLPEILYQFSKIHPEIDITVNVAEGHRALDILERGNADLAVAINDKTRNYQSHAQLDSHAMVIGPPSRFTDASDDVSIETLYAEPFVALTPGCPFRYALDQHFARLGLVFTHKLEVETQSAIVKLVSKGFGISVVDAIAATAETQQVSASNLYPPLRWTYHLLSPAKVNLSTAAQVFSDFVAVSWAKLQK